MTDENHTEGWATEESQEDLTDDFLYYFYKGGEMLSKGRLREAGEHLERAAEIRPDNPRCQNLLGLVSFKQGDFAQSIDIYRGLVERYNDDATLRVNLAMVLLKANLLQEAREELEQAIEIDPDNQKACKTMAVTLVKAGEQDLARVYLARAGIDDPDRFVTSPPSDEEDQQPEETNQAAVPTPEPAAPPSHPSSAETQEPEPEPEPEPAAPPSRASSAGEPAVKVIAPLPAEVAFELLGPDLETNLKGRLYTRLAGLVWMEGDLSFSTVRKQFNGEDTKYLFSKGPQAMIMVEGKGAMHFQLDQQVHKNGIFQVYSLEQSAYFLEDYVFAFCGLDTWENGRLAFKQESSLPILHLQAESEPAVQVVLSCPGAVERRTLTDQERFLLDVRRLVGWTGDLMPSLAKLGRPLPDGLWLELRGVGEVYYVSEPDDQ